MVKWAGEDFLYYLTVRFGIKTYEAYLEWCKETKEQIKEWEKK